MCLQLSQTPLREGFPFFFNLKLGSGVQMGNMSINNIRYADDTTLIEMEFDKLQMSTDALEEACSKWGMKINPAECKVMSEDPHNITL